MTSYVYVGALLSQTYHRSLKQSIVRFLFFSEYQTSAAVTHQRWSRWLRTQV